MCSAPQGLSLCELETGTLTLEAGRLIVDVVAVVFAPRAGASAAGSAFAMFPSRCISRETSFESYVRPERVDC
jgi:hypothetical protein